MWDSVIPDLSKFEVLSTKIEIKLKKVAEIQWDDLVNTGSMRVAAVVVGDNSRLNSITHSSIGKSEQLKCDPLCL